LAVNGASLGGALVWPGLGHSLTRPPGFCVPVSVTLQKEGNRSKQKQAEAGNRFWNENDVKSRWVKGISGCFSLAGA
jgi:hypothetical protein